MEALFPSLTTPQAKQIDILLRLLVGRAALDTSLYTDQTLPVVLRDFPCDLDFESASQPIRGWTCAQLLASMGSNLACWTTSPITVAAKVIMAADKEQAHVNAYLLSRLRTKLSTDLLLSTGAHNQCQGVKATLECMLGAHTGHPAALVDKGTRSGSVLRGQLLKLSNSAAKKCLLRSLAYSPARPALKTKAAWNSKLTVMAKIQKYKGFGPYTSSFFWQYYRLAVKYPKLYDKMFCSTGPGCRSGVNWFFGFPPTFSKDRDDDVTAKFYAKQLSRMTAFFQRNKFLQYCAEDSAELSDIKTSLREHLDSLEGKAFACCEFSKVVSHLLSSS